MFVCTRCIKEHAIPTSNTTCLENCDICKTRLNCYEIPQKIVAQKIPELVETNPFFLSVDEIFYDLSMLNGLNEQWQKVPSRIKKEIRERWSLILKTHLQEKTGDLNE